MGLTDDDLKSIAKGLPENIGKKSDARSRLLCVQELLRCATDENRGLTTSEIAKILSFRAKDGKLPSEPTVLEDVHSICENKPDGIQIEVPARGKGGGFRCVNANAAPEVKIEAIQGKSEDGADSAELFLLVSMDKAEEAQAYFGNGTKFENMAEEKGYLRVQVELSQRFFCWIFAQQGKVKIVPPGNDIWNKTGSWRNLSTASRNARDLRLDYEKAVSMYKEMLASAQNSIG